MPSPRRGVERWRGATECTITGSWAKTTSGRTARVRSALTGATGLQPGQQLQIEERWTRVRTLQSVNLQSVNL